MKIVRVRCTNPNCENQNKFTDFDLFDFCWDVEYINGDPPKDMFFELPSEIHCQKCLNLCAFTMKETN